MGLRKSHLEYFFEMFKLAGYEKFDGLKICELGNQTLRSSGSEYGISNGIPACKTGKELFTCFGFQHTSIDVNGEDGALQIDLTKPIQDPKLLSNFDIITNSGTTEHVSDQFECFKNLHNICKERGLFIHMVPSVKYKNRDPLTGASIFHGRYNYDFDFFRGLSLACGYKILDERIIRGLVSVTMQKTSDNHFTSKQQFDVLPILAVYGCE